MFNHVLLILKLFSNRNRDGFGVIVRRTNNSDVMQSI